MLKIRRGQLESIVDARATAFNAQVSGLLCQHCAGNSALLQRDYVSAIVEFSAKVCRDEHFSQPGTIFEFAQAMLQDTEQPLSQAQMAAKAQTIIRELRARALFEKLQAVTAAQARPGDSATAPGNALQE